MGLAFQEYIETYPAEALPKAGGVNATVVVTMTLETLLGGLKAAQLDTGEKITAGEARRLACQAGIIPAVLDGKSKVLDLGRKRRFHSESQRIVATIEQGGCSADGLRLATRHVSPAPSRPVEPRRRNQPRRHASSAPATTPSPTTSATR